MTDYPEGHVKHNPEENEVAVRTMFPEDQGTNLANMAWLVATTNSGARTVPSSAVESWDDLYSPVSGVVAPDPVVAPSSSGSSSGGTSTLGSQSSGDDPTGT